jgi:predicted transcriptional regulator
MEKAWDVMDNEVLMFVLSVFAFSYSIIYLKRKKIGTNANFLVTSMFFFMLASFATNAEHFYFYSFFNAVEHLSYAITSVCAVIWVYKAGPGYKPENYRACK